MDPLVDSEPSTLVRWAGRYPSLLVVAVALVARAPGYVRQLFDPDEAAIATMGMVVARGGVLYRDVIDRKPPIAPFLYAMSFWLTGSRDLRPVHLLAALELAGAALLLAYEVRHRAGPRAGWWAAGLLLAGAVAFSASDAQAANFSHLALLPACGAIVAARRGTARSAGLAGVLVGVAVLTRQTWIVGLGPAMVGAWLHGGRRASRAVLVAVSTAATIAAVGFVVPFGAFLHWTFSGNGSLLFDLHLTRGIVGSGLYSLAYFLGFHLALCWLAVRRGWKRDDLDLWLWLLSGLVAVAVGLRFFGHYWVQVLPPLCLLAAPTIASYTQRTRRALLAIVALPAVVCWGLAWSPQVDSHFDARPLAAEVRAYAGPHDKIAVWGAIPELYWLSGRAPGGALVITDFLVGRAAGHPNGRKSLREATPGALDEYLASLNADPPKLFLDTSPAGIREYRYYPVALVPAVQAFLDEHYRYVDTVDHVAIYELTNTPPMARRASRAPGR